MEINVNLHLTVSTELIDLLSELISNTKKSENNVNVIPEKSKKEKSVKVETATTPAGANGVSKEVPVEETKVDLSTIRQFVAGSEASKTAARTLLTNFGVAKLTELPAENYAEFFNKLKATL